MKGHSAARPARSPRRDQPRQSSKSLLKAFRILDLFAQRGPELGITQIADELSLNKTTVHRLLTAMAGFGLVEQNQDREKYRLGLKLFELGNLAVQSRGLQQQAHPLLQQMSQRCNETVHLAVPSDGEVVYLDKIESNSTFISIPSAIGRRLPAHCTGVGKVLLAYMKDSDLGELLSRKPLLKRTEHTITTATQLRKELARIRQQGYGMDCQEAERGLSCVAAPVWDHRHRIVASISISGPSIRFQGAELAQKIAMVKETAMAISLSLGYRG